MQGMKLQDVKMTDQMTGHETAGHKRALCETGSQKRQTFEAE